MINVYVQSSILDDKLLKIILMLDLQMVYTSNTAPSSETGYYYFHSYLELGL